MKILTIKYHRGVVGVLLIAVLVVLSSCAASKKSAQKITEAETWLEKIEQVEAMEYANDEFKNVQLLLEEARQFAERRKHKKAMLKADEAIVAAEVAEVKTLSRKAQESLTELKSSIQLLRKQLSDYREDQ